MAYRKITVEMIRKHFGPNARIGRKFLGGFRVTTSTGGDVEINQDGFTIHAGGDDVYEAITLLSGEAWGGMVAHGPTEHVVAMLAHGEATGVAVTPEVKPGCGCGALFVAVVVFIIVLGMAGAGAEPERSYGAFLIAAMVAGWVWSLMKKSQKRKAQRQAQTLRYPYPRIHGGPRQASRENATREGWI